VSGGLFASLDALTVTHPVTAFVVFCAWVCGPSFGRLVICLAVLAYLLGVPLP
jgi:hypothetical protein